VAKYIYIILFSFFNTTSTNSWIYFPTFALIVFFSRTRRRTAHQYIKKKKEGEKSPKKLLQKHRNKKLLQRKGSATHPKNPNYVVSLEDYKAGQKTTGPKKS